MRRLVINVVSVQIAHGCELLVIITKSTSEEYSSAKALQALQQQSKPQLEPSCSSGNGILSTGTSRDIKWQSFHTHATFYPQQKYNSAGYGKLESREGPASYNHDCAGTIICGNIPWSSCKLKRGCLYIASLMTERQNRYQLQQAEMSSCTIFLQATNTRRSIMGVIKAVNVTTVSI